MYRSAECAIGFLFLSAASLGAPVGDHASGGLADGGPASHEEEDLLLLQLRARLGWKCGEARKDVATELVHGNYSETAFGFLRLVAPERQSCQCTLDRTTQPEPEMAPCGAVVANQYFVCEEALSAAKSVWSFGAAGAGNDDWSQKVHELTKIVPRTYDCLDDRKPEGFPNDFAEVCLGETAGVRQTKKGDRPVETLHKLLAEAGNSSALVRLDIGFDEFKVLAAAEPEDLARIGQMQVQYHFSHQALAAEGSEIPKDTPFNCPDAAGLELAKKAIQRIAHSHAVVESTAIYFRSQPAGCLVDGKPFPYMMDVVYMNRGLCKPEIKMYGNDTPNGSFLATVVRSGLRDTWRRLWG